MDAADKLKELSSRRTLVMGVLNVTPDSFSDGGKYLDAGAAVAFARAMLEQGADLVDIGGESTRPGAAPVSLDEELARVLPVARALRGQVPGLLWSIDTQKAKVAQAALELGACMVNDVSGLRADEGMASVVAASGAQVVLMHRLGEPQGALWSTAENKDYGEDGVVAAVLSFLNKRAASAQMAGISEKKIWIDPGIGFGKTVDDNFRLLNALQRFSALPYPVLVGTSRKSMLGAALDSAPVDQRLEASLATAALACYKGAACVRVHDVKETVRVVRVIEAVKQAV
jgi:dihydropteroate synthase